MTPAASRKRITRSDGCAPLAIQALTLSRSSFEPLGLVLRQQRIEEAEPLDEAAVARRAGVGDHDVIDRPLLGAGAGEADFERHFSFPFFTEISVVPAERRREPGPIFSQCAVRIPGSRLRRPGMTGNHHFFFPTRAVPAAWNFRRGLAAGRGNFGGSVGMLGGKPGGPPPAFSWPAPPSARGSACRSRAPACWRCRPSARACRPSASSRRPCAVHLQHAVDVLDLVPSRPRCASCGSP